MIGKSKIQKDYFPNRLIINKFEVTNKKSGKVKHELRVTSSNPRVRRLKARVARLKARIEAIKPRVK